MQRSISKYGALQSKKRKKGGTLIRKTKYVYDREFWVALCVHKQQIPLLEWYATAKDIVSHEPIKVLDLLDCLYVEMTVGDERCFMIGFVDNERPPVEFAARTPEEARDWVKEIKKVLLELNCIEKSSNEYQAMPIQRESVNEDYDESPAPGLIRAEASPPQPSPLRNRAIYNLNAEIPLPFPTTPPPAIPPRPGQHQQQNEVNHATSSPIRIPSPEVKRQLEGNSTPPSPAHSPPLSPSLRGMIAKPPPRRTPKNSISNIPAEDLPPRLPPRKGPPSEVSSPVLPLSPRRSRELKTIETSNNIIYNGNNDVGSYVVGSSGGGGDNIKRYDFPLSPPPPISASSSSTTTARSSMNGTNGTTMFAFSPTSSPPSTTTKFRSPKPSLSNSHKPSPLPLSPPSSTITAQMKESAATYFILPKTPPPPPQLSPSAYEIPSSNFESEKRKSSSSNNNNNFLNGNTQPQPIYTKFTFPPDSSIASTSEDLEYRRLSTEMAQLRMSLISSSTDGSTKSDSPGVPPRPPKTTLKYAGSFREKNAVTKEISLLLSICLENLLIAEVAGNVWIAGWSESQNSLLCDKLHVGDQLVEVGGTQVKSISQFPAIFYNNAFPGQPIPLKVRTLPHGITYLITKPFNVYTPRTFGIIFHRKKNRIEEIITHTPAAKAGLLPKIPPFLYGRERVSAVISEVNGVPLNPFATNEQFYKRIEKLENGSEIQIICQPYDWVKLVKKQLKGIKNLKSYLQS